MDLFNVCCDNCWNSEFIDYNYQCNDNDEIDDIKNSNH